MFRSLIERLAPGRARHAPAAQAAAAGRRASGVTPTPERPHTQAVEPATSSLAGIGARRPLLSADGAVAGFEFRLSDTLIRRAEGPAQAAYTQAILTAMRVSASDGRVGLAELPASWLLKPPAVTLLCPGMLVCLRQEAGDADCAGLRSAAEAVRARGARAGWLADPPGGTGPVGRPDFVLLRPSERMPVDALLETLKRAAATTPRPSLVATDLPGLEVVELALRLGLDFASGSLATAAAPDQGTPVSPAARRLCQLLNRLLRDEHPAGLTGDIKRDVGLSLQLLRHVGSAHYARGTPIDTVEAAVMLMGRDGLYRWLSQVLVRSAGGRPASRAVQDVTLARARLLELLAERHRAPHPPSLFTLGLASMLPTLFETSVSEALGSMELAPEARAALLDSTGPWSAYLALARALERHDFDLAAGLAQGFGGLAAVLELSEQAWAWTAEQDAGA